MSTIDLDALEALVEAVTRSHDDVSPYQFVEMVRRLDDRGWQLTRILTPVEPLPLPSCFQVPASAPVWPPEGVRTKLWAELNPGGFELIEDWTGLRFAKVAKIPIIGAPDEAVAKTVLAGPSTKDHFYFAGETFEYHTDEIPF